MLSNTPAILAARIAVTTPELTLTDPLKARRAWYILKRASGHPMRADTRAHNASDFEHIGAACARVAIRTREIMQQRALI